MSLKREDIQNLLSHPVGQLSGTIYIPTHPDSTVDNVAADRIRFKNALQAIRRHANYNESELGESMKKLDRVHDDMEFWNYQNFGLAVFFNADLVEFHKLPFEVAEATYLTDQFIISPLAIVDELDPTFYVLDVNFTAPRLFRSQDGRLDQVNQDDMPGSFEDEVGKEEYQKQLQHQTSGPGAYHGHTEADAVSDEQGRYLKLLAERVDSFMQGYDEPLILTGTGNRLSAIRKYLGYSHVAEGELTGNVESSSHQDIYSKTVKLANDYLAAQTSAQVERLESTAPQYVAIGKAEILDIVRQEGDGRIDSLFLPIFRNTKDTVRAGNVRSLVIELPDDIDDLEEAVVSVLTHGGKLVPVEIGAHESLGQVKALRRF